MQEQQRGLSKRSPPELQKKSFEYLAKQKWGSQSLCTSCSQNTAVHWRSRSQPNVPETGQIITRASKVTEDIWNHLWRPGQAAGQEAALGGGGKSWRQQEGRAASRKAHHALALLHPPPPRARGEDQTALSCARCRGGQRGVWAGRQTAGTCPQGCRREQRERLGETRRCTEGDRTRTQNQAGGEGKTLTAEGSPRGSGHTAPVAAACQCLTENNTVL